MSTTVDGDERRDRMTEEPASLGDASDTGKLSQTFRTTKSTDELIRMLRRHLTPRVNRDFTFNELIEACTRVAARHEDELVAALAS